MRVRKLDNDTSVTKLARHNWGEVRFLCAFAKQLIDEANPSSFLADVTGA
ncbi:hypothetical protein [Enterococcus sp. AZ128]